MTGLAETIMPKPASRRDFLQWMGGAALASPVAAPLFLRGGRAQTGPERRIGYCIVGLGRISMGEFMPGVRRSRSSKLVALVSGHRDKAERMADQYQTPRRNIYDYEHYDAIAENPEIEAVYIALPNRMHAEYTIRAAQAGKHVLCEKPMATSAADCELMIDACRKANRKLMIAYRCQYEPTNLRAVKLVRDGQIGRLQVIESAFGFNIAPGEWRLNKKMAGGGPMVDVGIYGLQACRYLSGEEPTEVRANWSVIDRDGRFNEVEENLVWTMQFPSGVLASCSTSYGSDAGNYYRGVGPKGWVQVEPAFSYEGLRFKASIHGSALIDEPTDDPSPRQFTREADHFAECILEDKQPKTPGQEGLRDQKIIEAIYRSCARGHPVKL